MKNTKLTLSLIVARSRNNVIGVKGEIPWNLPADLAYFRKKTDGHAVVMGRHTHESIGRALPNRLNIVVTSNDSYVPASGCFAAQTLEDAINISHDKGYNKVFFMGGTEIYRAALSVVDHVFITEIDEEYCGDTFFPDFDPNDWHLESSTPYPMDEANPLVFRFDHYTRQPQ